MKEKKSKELKNKENEKKDKQKKDKQNKDKQNKDKQNKDKAAKKEKAGKGKKAKDLETRPKTGKRIVLTGGGTAGHVTPNIAMLPRLREMGYEICYIGTYDGIEKKLIEEVGIPYYGISSGKLRRYFSLKNFSDPFRVMKGFSQAKKLMKELHPDVVFSKGGFVSVPVVLAAEKKKIPVVIHESDMTPGLANKIALPKATRVCCNFPETAGTFPEGVATVTGTPIREELFHGDAAMGKEFCHFDDSRPVLLIMGGSSGSASVNQAIWGALPELLKDFQVAHITGQGKADETKKGTPGYIQFEYVKAELSDLFAAADVVISRAGANAICELLALHKPNVLIPLPLSQSRGDQILNAKSFEKSGYSKMLEEEKMTKDTLLQAVRDVYTRRDTYISAMQGSGDDAKKDSITMITEIIDSLVK